MARNDPLEGVDLPVGAGLARPNVALRDVPSGFQEGDEGLADLEAVVLGQVEDLSLIHI